MLCMKAGINLQRGLIIIMMMIITIIIIIINNSHHNLLYWLSFFCSTHNATQGAWGHGAGRSNWLAQTLCPCSFASSLVFLMCCQTIFSSPTQNSNLNANTSTLPKLGPCSRTKPNLVLAPVPFSAPKLTMSPDPALPPAPAATLHTASKTALPGWHLQQSPAHHCTCWRTSFKALPQPILSAFSFCSPSVPTASFSFRFWRICVLEHSTAKQYSYLTTAACCEIRLLRS